MGPYPTPLAPPTAFNHIYKNPTLQFLQLGRGSRGSSQSQHVLQTGTSRVCLMVRREITLESPAAMDTVRLVSVCYGPFFCVCVGV